MQWLAPVLALLLAFAPNTATAQTAREILITAAFHAPDRPSALAEVGRALRAADAALARDPKDAEAFLQRAVALSYRGKLIRSRADLITSRRGFEAAIAADPRNAEARMALAGWHLGAVIELGPALARMLLGARTAIGLAELDRSLALGGNHAFYPALAALHRIQLDPADVAGARRLAEAALTAEATAPADRLLQRQAALLLVPLRHGSGKEAAATAKRLLPFGRLK